MANCGTRYDMLESMKFPSSIISEQIDDVQVVLVGTSHPENIVSSSIEIGDISHDTTFSTSRAYPHHVPGNLEWETMGVIS